MFFLFKIGPSALPPIKCDLAVTKQRYYDKHTNKKNNYWYVNKIVNKQLNIFSFIPVMLASFIEY